MKIVKLKKIEMGRNVAWGEMSHGEKCRGEKCRRGEMSRGEMSQGEMSRGETSFGEKRRIANWIYTDSNFEQGFSLKGLFSVNSNLVNLSN